MKNNSSKNIPNSEEVIDDNELIKVLFENKGSQFENQIFLSRKKVLEAQKGEKELENLLKMKMKGLDMLYFVICNSKEIKDLDDDLICTDTFVNLLNVAKKEKNYQQILMKIRNITNVLVQHFCKNNSKKNEDKCNDKIIKFIITLLNIKFDNTLFKQFFDNFKFNQPLTELFLNQFLTKVFKGRNINFKLNDLKFITKAIICEKEILKNIDFFSLFSKFVDLLHTKQNNGCRTIYQLNQDLIILQYILELEKNSEVKKNIEEQKNMHECLQNILKKFEAIIDEFSGEENKDNDKSLRKFYSETNKLIIKLNKVFSITNNKENGELLNKILETLQTKIK